jgi:hypothetical protein
MADHMKCLRLEYPHGRKIATPDNHKDPDPIGERRDD